MPDLSAVLHWLANISHLLFWGGVFLLIVLFVFCREGVHFGWFKGKFGLRLSPPKGLSEEEVSKKIRDEFARYISGLDAYNHDLHRHDQDARVLITEKLDNIIFPEQDLDSTESALLRRDVLYVLLVMNLENHYVDASQSVEKLTVYLADKYKKILTALRPHIEDEVKAYTTAYDILSQWWALVSRTIHSKVLTDLATDNTRVDLLNDPAWARRMRQTIDRHRKTVASIEKMTSARPGALRYFSDEHIQVPDFLK